MSDNQTKEKWVKVWALVSGGKIFLAERCSKKQFIINWGEKLPTEGIVRAEIRIVSKRK